jgi:hypothetical protein
MGVCLAVPPRDLDRCVLSLCVRQPFGVLGSRQIDLHPEYQIRRTELPMITKHTHPKECPDHKAATDDRKRHEAVRKAQQTQQQAIAHAVWFEWYPASPRR